MNDMRQRRGAVYIRVSDDKWKSVRDRGMHGDHISSVAQQTEGEAAIRELGATLVGVYDDNDRGASRHSVARGEARPGWQRLREDIRLGAVNLVVMVEASRGDRQLDEWAKFLAECRQTGTLIHILQDETTYDVTKMHDWRTLVMQGVDSEIEADKISLRIRRATRRMRESGRPLGAIAHGYKSVYDTQTGKLLGREINEDGSAVQVREIYRMWLDGHSQRSIQRHMETARGLKLTYYAIGKMLRNPVYIGKIHGEDGQMINAQWPALISEEDWGRAQARMRTIEPGSRPARVRHLLSYLAVCDRCGAQLGVRQKGVYYGCIIGGCSFMRRAWMDEYVSARVCVWWARPETREALRRRASRTNDAVAAAEAQLEKLEQRRAELGADLSDPDIPAGITREALRSVGSQIRDLQARIDAMSSPTEIVPMLQGDSLEEVRGEWDRMGREGMVAAQREIVRATLEEVRLVPRGRGRRTGFDPKFIIAPYRQI